MTPRFTVLYLNLTEEYAHDNIVFEVISAHEPMPVNRMDGTDGCELVGGPERLQ